MSVSRIAITTGDSDGIGFEIASKALEQLGPKKNVQFIVWRSALSTTTTWSKPIQERFTIVTVPSLTKALSLPHQSNLLIDLASPQSPGEWIFQSAHACLKKNISVLVTGPISKPALKKSGFPVIGHTELLAKISKQKSLYMGFLGEHMNVVLATGHVPLHQVPRMLTNRTLWGAILAAQQLKTFLKSPLQSLPIALVGVNPHAGDQKLIGHQESRNFVPIIKKAQRSNIPIIGPLVPDVAFLPTIRKRVAVYVCPYHDQGLIPFKLLHGFSSGVHVTLGLPFLRASVDHGTAKDIAGKNLADPGSMIAAIQLAIKGL